MRIIHKKNIFICICHNIYFHAVFVIFFNGYREFKYIEGSRLNSDGFSMSNRSASRKLCLVTVRNLHFLDERRKANLSANYLPLQSNHRFISL